MQNIVFSQLDFNKDLFLFDVIQRIFKGLGFSFSISNEFVF